ncbi:TPA_asm: hypothetical protein G0G79_14845 [Salmonella enterica]|nr:hypothetical protein [Salmonella enterica]
MLARNPDKTAYFVIADSPEADVLKSNKKKDVASGEPVGTHNQLRTENTRRHRNFITHAVAGSQ